MTFPCCGHCDHYDPQTGTDSAVVDDPPPHARPCSAEEDCPGGIPVGGAE